MTLMNLVSSVFQEVILFNDTIYKNIRMEAEDMTEEDIIAASKMAHCHEFISVLPAGYQTIVGERGAKLSGGEKQRISIAMAILKDAPVIMFIITPIYQPRSMNLMSEII